MAEFKAQLAAKMGGAPESGYDAVIVCCSGTIEANYWQQRLEGSKGVVLPKDALVLSVDEDWNGGGAGNGLGTLYAYKKAAAKALEQGVDLTAKLASGDFSVAIYHTAGKGTRLAPLPAAENNNKPGVKLPATVKLTDGKTVPITILEAVIKQTASYAACRKGRLSVYWGDQIFIPSEAPDYKPTAHIDLLAQMLKVLPTPQVWEERGLASYGLAVMLGNGAGVQIEKVDHATATSMLSELGEIASVGPSLGSFSVSAAMLVALSKEFTKELDAKTGAMDTDPHFWMPLTLPKAAYAQLMGKKGVAEDESNAHFDRMRAMLATIELGDKTLFGAVNVGEDAYWWDYGQITFYSDNNLRLTQDGEENDAYRSFFSQPRGAPKDSTIGATADANSSIACSNVAAGAIKGSVLCNVTAKEVQAEGAILVNCSAKKITAAPGAIAYNVVDDSEEGLVLEAGKVITSVFGEDGSVVRMNAHLSTDGKDAWKKVLEGNEYSFEQMHAKNKGVDPVKAEAAQRAAHEELAKKIAA
eukprot:TRINITY_DN7976_c0_g1_i1.p1 TRINITY_DN7976_c0_g1~~TRINITY_DN7976_c0_g1_i1.p1  ORF type:complete len:528 (+),score=270.41 TRINITY_DN7976_c0_g1_i1:50-1633(+)